MSFWDDLKRLTENLLQGDLSGALGDLDSIADHTVGAAQKGQSGSFQVGVSGPLQFGGNLSKGMGSLNGGMQGGLTSGKQDAAKQTCCNRFSLNNGFLVDGVSGRVWQFTSASNTFDEVPVKNHSAKQGLIDSLLEGKLSSIRAQYEQEMLATVPRAKRATALAQFEKDHLDPVREAAQGVTY